MCADEHDDSPAAPAAMAEPLSPPDSMPDAPPSPRRVAVVVAHPDDAEFSCAATVAKWAREGQEVSYVLLTSGDKGSSDPTMTPERLVATREAEQRAACDLLGVREVVFLHQTDAMLVPDLTLRRELVRVIRRLKPHAVVCQDPTVYWSGQNYINHPDHRAAAQVTLDALYPAARDRMTFPELLAEGLEPHAVNEVYLLAPAEPDHWIDVTETMPIKFAALRAHASQIVGWDPEPMLTEWAREGGAKMGGGVEFAEGFKYFKLD